MTILSVLFLSLAQLWHLDVTFSFRKFELGEIVMLVFPNSQRPDLYIC